MFFATTFDKEWTIGDTIYQVNPGYRRITVRRMDGTALSAVVPETAVWSKQKRLQRRLSNLSKYPMGEVRLLSSFSTL